MSLQQVVNYNNPANFTYDPLKIDVTANAQLNRAIVAGQTGDQNFDNDTGFTYDNTKAEFSGGLARTKSQAPANSLIGITYTSTLNASWRTDAGSLVGVNNGTPVLAAGKMQCFGANGRYYSYTTSAVETHKWIHTPNYTGSPAPNVDLLVSNNGSDFKDRFQLMHSGTGSARLYINDNTGASILGLTVMAGYTPVAGVDDEFELVIDSVLGTIRLFINGTLVSTLSPGPWARGGISTRVYLGAAIGGYNNANQSYENYILFNNAQHTATYVPGYSLKETLYLESSVVLPAMAANNISSFDGFTATVADVPKFVVDGQYWNGAAWVASDSSYSQSSTIAQLNTNLPTLAAVDNPVIKVTFYGSNTLQSIDTLQLGYSEFTTYYMDNPFILVNSGVLCDALDSIAENVTKVGSDEIRYCVNVDGICYWNNPATLLWEVATSYLTSNTVAEINANASSLDLAAGKTVKITAILHSFDGSTTPILTSITINYDFAHDATTPLECVVYGTVRDVSGNPVEGAKITCEVEAPFYYDENLISRKYITFTNVDGEWDISAVENATHGGSYKFTSEYNDLGKNKKQVDGGIVVPNAATASLSSLV
jgi:hypothetical protein